MHRVGPPRRCPHAGRAWFGATECPRRSGPIPIASDSEPRRHTGRGRFPHPDRPWPGSRPARLLHGCHRHGQSARPAPASASHGGGRTVQPRHRTPAPTGSKAPRQTGRPPADRRLPSRHCRHLPAAVRSGRQLLPKACDRSSTCHRRPSTVVPLRHQQQADSRALPLMLLRALRCLPVTAVRRHTTRRRQRASPAFGNIGWQRRTDKPLQQC